MGSDIKIVHIIVKGKHCYSASNKNNKGMCNDDINCSEPES